jgi:hypothetical protein
MDRMKKLKLILLTILAACTITVQAQQFSRPDNDDSIGSYTDDGGGTTNIHDAIDEVTASDTDYIRSENDPSTSLCVIGISSVTDPVSSTGHVVRYRYAKGQSGGGSPGVVDIVIRLREGTTTIASQSHSGITTTWTDGSFTLSGAEADSITDYSNLNIQYSSDKSSGARTSWAQFSWSEFEVPSVGGTRRIFIIN